MFVTITEDATGDILMQRKLNEDDTLDLSIYAQEFCDKMGVQLSKANGHVPDHCGDFTVELAERPKSNSCWDVASFFFEES